MRKILSSVSGILEYNCCKIEALVFNLIGKYIRKELTGCSKTRFFFQAEPEDPSEKGIEIFGIILWIREVRIYWGKGLLIFQGKKDLFLLSQPWKGGFLPPSPPYITFPSLPFKNFLKVKEANLSSLQQNLVVTFFFLFKLIPYFSTFLSLMTVHSNNES